jgi:glycosyltransferase involved in cell wall biosynthesis
LFSIIIPLYNKAAYIEKAIHSVLSQTFQEFELIVIDDGSTDKGFDVVQTLFTALTPPLGGWEAVRQENQGVSTARNNGVKLTKYDYIAFLDADDWWEPTYLEEMKGLIEMYPQAGIYGSSYYIVKNGQKRLATIGVESDFERGLINYCRVYAKTLCMPLWTGATIVKKIIYEEEKGFKANLKLGEDFDLWVRVALNHQVALLNKPLANYNQDVELKGRAIGRKLYRPDEHMLFSDYGTLMQDIEFKDLFEKLALYGLLPYYLAEKNSKETSEILKNIHWENQAIKYRLYYRILPRKIVRLWFWLISLASQIKNSKMIRL